MEDPNDPVGSPMDGIDDNDGYNPTDTMEDITIPTADTDNPNPPRPTDDARPFTASANIPLFRVFVDPEETHADGEDNEGLGSGINDEDNDSGIDFDGTAASGPDPEVPSEVPAPTVLPDDENPFFSNFHTFQALPDTYPFKNKMSMESILFFKSRNERFSEDDIKESLTYTKRMTQIALENQAALFEQCLTKIRTGLANGHEATLSNISHAHQ
ncbi:hypothetical protein ABG067_007959, partial [Albugo candida]